MIREVLLLGNPKLYEISEPVVPEEVSDLKDVIEDLHDTLMDYRRRYGAGRAIAAPQIGVMKRIIYMNTGSPVVLLNPALRFPDDEMIRILDDCMSFPGLYVYVLRHQRCVIEYRNLNWQTESMALEGDLSELLQHEFDHLDGILATMRAIDEKSFVMKTLKK